VQLGVGYYGAAGDEVAQAPIDVPTLATVNDYVNGGIRMFLADAPAEGWRFQQPTASLVLWPTATSTANGAPVFVTASTVTVHTRMFRDTMVGHDLAFTVTSTADGVPTYDSAADTTTLDVDDAIFTATMVEQTVTFTATGESYTIIGYTDTTTVTLEGDASGEADGDTVTVEHNYVISSVTSTLIAVVTGDASGEADGATVTVTADGNYTLPSAFGGEYLGPITHAAGSNVGASVGWVSEGQVRRLRENTATHSGDPTIAAIRKMEDVARRWEMIVYPIPGSTHTLEFPYQLYFTELTAATDMHPAGALYDEAVKAACASYAEMQGEDVPAGRTEYYRGIALLAAYRINNRAAPRRLGSLKHTAGRRDWRDSMQRPDVTIS